MPGIRLVDVTEGCLGLEYVEGPPIRILIPAGMDEPYSRRASCTGEKGREPEWEEIVDDLPSAAARLGCVNKITMGMRLFGRCIGVQLIVPSFSESLLEKIGVEIAKLHLIDIIHGDLTTSNMLLRASNNDLVRWDKPRWC